MQWLASFIISGGQDIFLVQPTKVVIAVIVISFLLTRKNKATCEKEEEKEEEFSINLGAIEIDTLGDDPK